MFDRCRPVGSGPLSLNPRKRRKCPVSASGRRGAIFGRFQFLASIFRRTPANPPGERVREDKRVVITDLAGHGFDSFFGRSEQFGSPSHAQVSHLMHRASTELSSTETAQMFATVAGFTHQTV